MEMSPQKQEAIAGHTTFFADEMGWYILACLIPIILLKEVKPFQNIRGEQ